MEQVIRHGADFAESRGRASLKVFSECRNLAIGLIAIGLEYTEVLWENAAPDRKEAYCLACAIAFAQGATISASLIAQGQYVKAATAVKQDIELIARFHEVAQDRAVEGKTPQISSLHPLTRKAYGELNKVAHPSNLDEMHFVLSSKSGHFSVAPLNNNRTGRFLYGVHIATCYEMAVAVIDLVFMLSAAHEPTAEFDMALKGCTRTLKRLEKKLALI